MDFNAGFISSNSLLLVIIVLAVYILRIIFKIKYACMLAAGVISYCTFWLLIIDRFTASAEQAAKG